MSLQEIIDSISGYPYKCIYCYKIVGIDKNDVYDEDWMVDYRNDVAFHKNCESIMYEREGNCWCMWCGKIKMDEEKRDSPCDINCKDGVYKGYGKNAIWYPPE